MRLLPALLPTASIYLQQGRVVAAVLIGILRHHCHYHTDSIIVNTTAPPGPMDYKCSKDFLLREFWVGAGTGRGPVYSREHLWYRQAAT